jgi:hypothetical protein
VLLPHDPRDDEWDPEAYVEGQAARMRAAYLKRVASDRRWNAKWDDECSRPIGERQYFTWAEIAQRLACDPHTLAVDTEIAARIVDDLAAWVRRRHFAAGGVVTLSGDRPKFRPFQLARGEILVPNAEGLFLRREVCRRYAEARAELPGAAGLLRDWFTAGAAEANVTDAARQPPLHGKEQPLLGAALDNALDKWVLKQWGGDLTKLPNRDQLLLLARKEPRFEKVSQQDIRALRDRHAPNEIKKGGAKMHRRP